MPGREHEAVAVDPGRIAGVVLHDPREEQVGGRRETERRAGMSGLGGLDRVDGERPDRVDAQLVDVDVRH